MLGQSPETCNTGTRTRAILAASPSVPGGRKGGATYTPEPRRSFELTLSVFRLILGGR